MQASLLRKPVAALCALSLLVLQPAAHAGDLNTEVTNMFNNLGAVGNYTAPGAFKGQTFNTFTGGNLYLRSPNKTYQLAAIQFPSAKGGCGGIDLFCGAARHRVSAGAGVGVAAAGRADEVGEGAGDLDQQRPGELVRNRHRSRVLGR